MCVSLSLSGQVELHKKELNSLVKSLVRLTNSDWHDGYMEQNEKIQEYVTRAGKFIHDGKVCACHNAFVCAGACVIVCVCERVYVYACAPESLCALYVLFTCVYARQFTLY